MARSGAQGIHGLSTPFSTSVLICTTFQRSLWKPTLVLAGVAEHEPEDAADVERQGPIQALPPLAAAVQEALHQPAVLQALHRHEMRQVRIHV